MKYYITADTHGYCSLLKNALDQSGFFTEKADHKLIILGDLFDRGEEAKEMQDFILQQMETGNLILVKGNHEDLFQELVTEEMDEDALEALADSLCERASVLTASETGAGIVPVGAGARRIRENQGRLLQMLARRADSVVRVFYGIPEVIRGQV